MSKTFPICSALVSAAVILSGPAWADTLTWKSGGTDTNWSTPGNWTSKEGTHTVPQDGDTVVLSGTSANDLGSDAAPLQLAGLTASGSVTLTGNPLAFPTANSTISFSGGKFTCGVKIVGTATDGDFNIKGAADATFVANADIEAKSRIVLRLYGSSNVINGKITTPGKKILSYVNGGTCAYNGSLTCSTFATNNGPGVMIGEPWPKARMSSAARKTPLPTRPRPGGAI